MNPLGVEGIQGVFDFLANTYFLHPADVVAMAGDDLMQLTFPGDGNDIVSEAVLAETSSWAATATTTSTAKVAPTRSPAIRETTRLSVWPVNSTNNSRSIPRC